MQKLLVDLFSKILLSDKETLARVSVFNGDMTYYPDDAILVFNLRALHVFLYPEVEVDYKSFRGAIYKGNLNEELLKLGGRIEVHESSRNVDRSYYRLVKIT